MRIVSGTLRGRRFTPPESFDARPTTDFARENLFNIISNFADFDGLKVLDLFGGTGAFSYEFVSRGCEDVTCVEKNPAHFRFIAKTVGQFGIADRVKLVRGDALRFLGATKEHYDLIFADPPFAMAEVDELPSRVMTADLLRPGGIFILEHSGAGRFNGDSNFWQTRAYGKVNFTLFKHA